MNVAQPMWTAPLTVALVALGLGACTLAWAADAPTHSGATVDAHTLLLERFEDDIRTADYAVGMAAFAGNGARQAPGYYGQGIDLRKSGLQPDFMATSRDYTPRADGWGFHSRGNVSPWQGTFECWFRTSDPREPRLLYSHNFLNAELCYSVPLPNTERYGGFGLTINKFGMRYQLPTVAGNVFQGELTFKTLADFGRYLEPEDWHHFAMTWDQGALVLYIDGRRAVSYDMTDQKGLVLVSSPVRYLNMSDMYLDELRISDVVRYTDVFEPAWRDGQRPQYAFTGNPEAAAFPQRSIVQREPTREAPAVTHGQGAAQRLGPFALELAADGSVSGFAVAGLPTVQAAARGGLSLNRGLDREPVVATSMQDLRTVDGHLRYTQHFAGDIVAAHDLHERDGVLHWQINLRNDGAADAWLEPLLGLDLPLGAATEIFDGVEPRRGPALEHARLRDEYAHTLPFVAATDGSHFVGIGVDPYVDLSEIVSEWLPADGGAPAVVRQGARVVLGPGESWTLRYVVLHGAGDFGVLDAVSAYHACFPDLYHLRPDVTVYTYMPMTQYAYSDPYFDMKRIGMAGSFWGHGPGHDKGDEYGTPEWWDNPDLYGDRAYERYTRRIERLWETPMQLREVISLYYRQSYDNWYSVRRFHTCPDVTPSYILKQTWPDYVPNEDPLCFGQYYQPSYSWSIVNEYNTPIGAHIQEQSRQYMLATQGYCPGFINDMSHAGSLYRHNDPIAQQTNGRAWSRDLGPFVRKAIGRRQRYETLNDSVLGGTRLSVWSDGGSFSYTLGAFSAGIAIEGAGMYRDLTGSATYVSSARYLVGEKPFSAMTHMNDDWIGYFLSVEDFPTAASLRDYYRYAGRQLMLWAIRHGVSLDASSYMWGRQAEHELNPLLVESTVRGRQVVPAARVDAPLWVVRAGHGLNTLFVVGNTEPTTQTSDMRVYERYFDGRPLLAPYYGGALTQTFDDGIARVAGVEVAPRDAAGFLVLGLLDTTGAAGSSTALSGDGITVTLELDLTLAADARLRLGDLAPVYALASLEIDGAITAFHPGEPVALTAGTHRVVARYRCPHLDFDAEAWRAVELFRDGATNFAIVGEPSARYVVRSEDPPIAFDLGFEAGTLGMLNDFVAQYDSENGVYGDLEKAPILSAAPATYDGWIVTTMAEPTLATGTVRIDASARRITVCGPTAGERRRALVVWMRLLDRKYPHVGRFHPFAYRKSRFDNRSVDFEKWIIRKGTRDFFMAFDADPLFMAKPILDARYEALYADGNMDFAGRYTLRTAPFLVEPTADDDFVYGYKGSGSAPTREQLLRPASPPPDSHIREDGN